MENQKKAQTLDDVVFFPALCAKGSPPEETAPTGYPVSSEAGVPEGREEAGSGRQEEAGPARAQSHFLGHRRFK